MATASNVASDPFVTLIEACADVNGRYQRPKALRPWSKDGYFSLLFKATDKTTGKDVALKFFDPKHNADIYRRQCFSREPRLLYKFIARDNIVQLIEGEQTFSVPVTAAGGVSVPFPNFLFRYRTRAREFEGLHLFEPEQCT